MIIIAPWPFGSAPEIYQCLLIGGLAILAVCCSLAIAFDKYTVLPKPTLDIVSLSLIGIALWTAFQIVPLPGEVVRAISPERFEWHQTFLPDANEVSIFTGEEPSRPRPDWLTLSVAPQASRDFLSQLLPVLFVYLVCRSWLGSQGGLRRLAWWLTIVGIALTALAIAQFFTSRNDTIFWQFRLDRAEVFGPFVCRNHFPDYVNFSIG